MLINCEVAVTWDPIRWIRRNFEWPGPPRVSLGPVSDLVIDVAPEGPGQVVRLKGELDLVNAEQLAAALGAVTESDPGRVAIDLSDCDFIDSAGLAAILHGAQQIADAGGSVRIACPEGNLRDLLRITAIDQSIPVVGTRDEALAAMGLDAD